MCAYAGVCTSHLRKLVAFATEFEVVFAQHKVRAVEYACISVVQGLSQVRDYLFEQDALKGLCTQVCRKILQSGDCASTVIIMKILLCAH